MTAYYINMSWEYKEILLAFEPLEGCHSGKNLAAVVMKVLKEYELEQQFFTMTTDNASNNHTLRKELQESLQLLSISWDMDQMKIPCLAHIIQLSVNALLSKLQATATNDEQVKKWDQAELDIMGKTQYGFAKTLAKESIIYNSHDSDE